MTATTDIGRVVADRYRIEARVGRGGYGTVYRARDVELDRDVAIKLVRMSEFTDSRSRAEEIRRRFRQEARAAARVRHPNIVTIYDVGAADDGDELYIVMELLEGHSLADEIGVQGRIPLSRARVLFVPCLEGLAAAHDNGIIHKDLKPTNLILDRPGRSDESLQIIDFGVARLVDSAERTATGKMAGTPRYSAPEYIMGDEVTPALDIYQMGLIIAEALAGFPAVPSGLDARATIQRHLGGVLDLAEEVVDSPVGPVLARALAAEPEERFGDAATFARALDTIDVSEWVYDDENSAEFTPRTYTPSGSFGADGAYTPSGSFTPVGSREREPLAVDHDAEALDPTVVDTPSAAAAAAPHEPVEEAAAETAPAPAEQRDSLGLARIALAALLVVSLTGLVGLYIYRSTDPGQPASDIERGSERTEPASPSKSSGVQKPVKTLMSPQDCRWALPDCEIDCTIDVEAGTHDCPEEVSVELQEDHARAAIEVPTKEHSVSVVLDYCRPEGWLFHMADSPTCNGGGGDAGTTQHNAELQVVRGDVTVFHSDPPADNAVLVSRGYPGLLRTQGCTTSGFHFADQLIAIDGNCTPVSGDLLRLDPPRDREGTPDRTWYLALNTTYLESGRSGEGVRSARVCIGPRTDDLSRDP